MFSGFFFVPDIVRTLVSKLGFLLFKSWLLQLKDPVLTRKWKQNKTSFPYFHDSSVITSIERTHISSCTAMPKF